MLNRDEIQSRLPPGLRLNQKRSVPPGAGELYEALDERLASKVPLRRHVRILNLDAQAGWHTEWFQILQRLSERNHPGICRPLEMGLLGDRHIYVVLDHYSGVLADQIPQTGLPDRKTAWSVFDQVASSLAELHRSVGPHGDLRTENIVLDTPQLTRQSRLAIGHAELAGLPHWTNGELMCPGARKIFPPEWNRQLGEASATADVYALGLLAVELFEGVSERLRVQQNQKLIAHWGKIGWLHNRWLVEPMLAAADRRLKDGPAVWGRMRLLRRIQRGVKIASGCLPLVAAITVMMGLGWWRWTGQLATQASELSSAQSELVAAQKSLATERESSTSTARSLEAAREQVRNLERKLGERNPQPMDEAQEVWTKNFVGHLVKEFAAIHESLARTLPADTDGLIKNWRTICEEAHFLEELRASEGVKTARNEAYEALQKAPWDADRKEELVKAFWQSFLPDSEDAWDPYEAEAEAIAKIPLQSWLRAELSGLLKQVEARRAHWARWSASQPPELIDPWSEFVKSPWDETRRREADAQLAALQRAEAAWKRVVSRELSWKDFQEQLRTAVETNDVDGLARRIVETWIDQFHTFSSPGRKASVTLLRGTSPSGSGRYRTCDVYIANSRFALDDELGHNWAVETAHTYAPPLSFSFPWKPGQSIQIKIYGERQTLRAYGRPAYLNKSFSGPVALWELSQDGSVSEGQHVLEWEVESCPGPPPP